MVCPELHVGIKGDKRDGKLMQLTCDVHYYILTPVVFENTHKLSVKYMVIISKGEHNHPPPPPRRLSSETKTRLIQAITQYGVEEATARRLTASPYMSIILDGKREFSMNHIPLINQSVVNHIIRMEKAKQLPFGTDFLGVQHQMTLQDPTNPYIRIATMFPDGKFLVLCQFKDQSRLLFEDADELMIDKTFNRTQCTEFEVNYYSRSAEAVGTIARVFTDYEHELGYYHAFKAIMDTAQADMNTTSIPWGHLTSVGENIHRIKAILADEHAGQAKGVGRYFEEHYPPRSAQQHLRAIMKTCQVHYSRTIHKLEVEKHVSISTAFDIDNN